MRWLGLFCFLWSLAARAEAPAPYSLPWQLRPAIPVNVLRLDTSLASYRTTDGGFTSVSVLLAAKKLHPDFSLMVRTAIVHDSPPVGTGAMAITNPFLGAFYSRKLTTALRITGFLGAALPLGMGGGDSPDRAVASAVRSGVLARFGMDSALFAANDFAILPGIDLAWVHAGWTVQVEATVIQYFRAKGGTLVTGTGAPPPQNPDAIKTSATAGIHVGWFAQPWLSLGGELRGQRWFSTPAAVRNAPDFRETLSAAAGARVHFQAGPVTFRPGLAYAQGLDAPLTTRRYRVVQIDIPAVF